MIINVSPKGALIEIDTKDVTAYASAFQKRSKLIIDSAALPEKVNARLVWSSNTKGRCRIGVKFSRRQDPAGLSRLLA